MVRRDSSRPGQAHSKQPLSAERLDGLGKGLHLICAMMGSSIEALEVGCLRRTAVCDTELGWRTYVPLRAAAGVLLVTKLATGCAEALLCFWAAAMGHAMASFREQDGSLKVANISLGLLDISSWELPGDATDAPLCCCLLLSLATTVDDSAGTAVKSHLSTRCMTCWPSGPVVNSSLP